MSTARCGVALIVALCCAPPSVSAQTIDVVRFFAGAARKSANDGTGALGVYALAAGYLLVWGAFSVAATGLQQSGMHCRF